MRCARKNQSPNTQQSSRRKTKRRNLWARRKPSASSAQNCSTEWCKKHATPPTTRSWIVSSRSSSRSSQTSLSKRRAMALMMSRKTNQANPSQMISRPSRGRLALCLPPCSTRVSICICFSSLRTICLNCCSSSLMWASSRSVKIRNPIWSKFMSMFRLRGRY